MGITEEIMIANIIKHFERLGQIEPYDGVDNSIYDKGEIYEYLIFDKKLHLEFYSDEVEVRKYDKNKDTLDSELCSMPLKMFYSGLVSNFAYLRDTKII